ncbi:hypothetical protein Tco_1179564 [Tanacetum coccineum]
MVGASRIVEDQMKNTLKTEHPQRREASRLHRYEDPPEKALSSKESVQWKKAINEEMVSLEKNHTCSLVRLPTGKKASQRLWMFKVKEEQNSSEKEPSYVGALNDTSTQHKSEGFQLAGQEENLECRLKEILYELFQAPMPTVDDMLIAGSDMAEFNKPKWVLIFVEDSWNEEPCRDVHQVGDEREFEVLRNFNWLPSELITDDGVLPERGYSQFNDVSSGYLVAQPQVNPDSTIAQELYTVQRSKNLYIRRSFRSLWKKPNLQRTDTGVEGTTEGRKQNRNKSKSWKIGEIKYRQNITCWNYNQKGHFYNQCSKLVASKDKEVNQAARDSDNALVCCVENTICKEELERFKLRSGKVRLADDKTLDIAGVRDVVLKTSFGTSWTLKDVRYILGLKRRRLISAGQLEEEGYHVGFRDQQ